MLVHSASVAHRLAYSAFCASKATPLFEDACPVYVFKIFSPDIYHFSQRLSHLPITKYFSQFNVIFTLPETAFFPKSFVSTFSSSLTKGGQLAKTLTHRAKCLEVFPLLLRSGFKFANVYLAFHPVGSIN